MAVDNTNQSNNIIKLYDNVIKPVSSNQISKFGPILYKKPSSNEINRCVKQIVITSSNAEFKFIENNDKIDDEHNYFKNDYDNSFLKKINSFNNLFKYLKISIKQYPGKLYNFNNIDLHTPNSIVCKGTVYDGMICYVLNSLFIKTNNKLFNETNSKSIKVPFHPLVIILFFYISNGIPYGKIIVSTSYHNYNQPVSFKSSTLFSSIEGFMKFFDMTNYNYDNIKTLLQKSIKDFKFISDNYNTDIFKISNDGQQIILQKCTNLLSDNIDNIVTLCGNEKNGLDFIVGNNSDFNGISIEKWPNGQTLDFINDSNTFLGKILKENKNYIKQNKKLNRFIKMNESFNFFKRNRQIPRKMNNYTHRMNEAFTGDKPVYAAINIDPSTPLNLNQGDEVTASMFRNPDDRPIADLVSIGDTAVIDDILDDGTYKLVISVSEPDSATDLYNWIIENTNATDDNTIERYVAPGLIDLMNDSDIDNSDDSYDDIDDSDLDDLADEADAYNESVSSKFSKYRNLYESAVSKMNESDSLNEKDDKEDDSSDDDLSDLFSDDDTNDDSSDDNKDSSDDDNKSDDEQSDDSEDVPMTAVVLTVKKDDVDKCKDEMVSAGIPDEDIEILDGEDDDENAKIKVDANSVKELKDYLQGKGIDLEEKIGGEIIDDEEGDEDSSDEDKDKDGNDKDKEDGDDTPSDDFDMSDLFGDDDDDSSDDKK